MDGSSQRIAKNYGGSKILRNRVPYYFWYGRVLWVRLSKYRERKSNTNFFRKLFRRPRDIPAKSRDILPKKFDFPGFEGRIELFGPHPFTWKTPTPLENIRTKKFGFGFLFLPENLICAALRLPFVPAILLRKYQPVVGGSGKFLF